MGAAQAGIFPCSANSLSKWFPSTQRGLPSGLLASFMSIGGAAGAFLTGQLLEHLGWRWIFLLYVVPGVIWAVGFYLWFRDRPEEHPSVGARELEIIRGLNADASAPPAELRAPIPWGAILSSWPMWCICGQQFFRAAGYMFFASWFATYLQEVRKLSPAEAGFLTSLPLCAVVLGSPTGGLLSDWLLARTGSRRISRQGLSIVSLLACTVLVLVAYPIENVRLAAVVISLGSLCASLAGPCAYSLTMDMGGKHVTTVFSMMNMAGNVGAFLFPVVVPSLVRGTGEWDVVFTVFAGIYLAAAFCWMPFNPGGTIFERDTGRPTVEGDHQ
jgi:nitrate/nitrite transporter NarK